MCGIAGIFSFDGRPVDRPLLERMNRLMTHRGPDADGFYQEKSANLAMRRLKVIDLSTGDQPIHNENKSLWIVFNGEIYNYRELRRELVKKGHRFYTESDTEVILHQYQEEGADCVRALKGMFVFAIYDVRNDSLFIARDRLGVKPLFYHRGPEGVVFASEIKPVLESPWVSKRINIQAVSHYLSLNYLPQPWTPFDGIEQLPPGHWMNIRKGAVEVRRYWEIPLTPPIEDSEEAAVRKIEDLLHRSIERRLISDVPLGAFLSGGLDSSSLVALMKEHKQGVIKTFSVGFGEKDYDETGYAEQVARRFGTEHHEIVCSPGDLVDNLPKIAWHADNLLADQAALPLYIVSRLARRHVTVCLSGDGGDELFVGYPTFQANAYRRVYAMVPKLLREALVNPLVRALPASAGKVSFEYKAKKFIEATDFDAEKAHYWWRTIFTDAEKRQILRPEVAGEIREWDAYPLYRRYFEEAGASDFSNRALFADMKVWLAGNNLYKVDTMSMAHGLEARVPFLDHELVEYVARLPFAMKFRGGVLKHLLKKVMKGRLPENIVYRRKAGWHAPIAGWFRGPLRGYVESVFSAGQPAFDSLIEKKALNRLLSEHFSGTRNHGFKIWGLLVLHHWASQFFSESGQKVPATAFAGS